MPAGTPAPEYSRRRHRPSHHSSSHALPRPQTPSVPPLRTPALTLTPTLILTPPTHNTHTRAHGPVIRIRIPRSALCAALLFCLFTALGPRTQADDQARPNGTVFGRAEQLQQELACKKLSNPEPLGPEEFLQQWIRSPSCRVCGQWQKHYADLHASIRNGSAPKRFITFDNPENMPGDFPRPGLGDYLIGMVTTFITGLLTNRAFVMPESRLTEVIEISRIDWRVRDDVPMAIVKGSSEVVKAHIYNRGEKGWHDSVKFPTNIIEHFSRMDDAVNVRVGTNGGVLSRIFRNRTTATYFALHKMGLRMPTAFGCIVRFIFTPKREVWRMIVPPVGALQRPKTSTIGIHMRTTDHFAWKGGGYSLDYVFKTTDKTLLKCAKDTADFTIPEGHKTVWLFLSDSVRLRNLVLENYSQMVMNSPLAPAHPQFNGSAMASVMAEWLMFSTCQSFVITESGFAKTAVAYNIQEPRLFLFAHFQFAQAKGSCDQAQPGSLLDFHRWSGL